MNASPQSVADRGGERETERERKQREGGRTKKSRSHKTEGLESIIRQQGFFSLSSPSVFPKRKEA